MTGEIMVVVRQYFNPRSLVGNDRSTSKEARHTEYFNPRSLVGNDTHQGAERTFCNLFQSTFPRGERRISTFFTDLGNDFNPRSLVGNDGSANDIHRPLVYFNPRSLVGNDKRRLHKALEFIISIHVPSWGTTEFQQKEACCI